MRYANTHNYATLIRAMAYTGVAAFLLIVAGCSGHQSALNPTSPHANLIANLWWGMLAIALLVFVSVMALLVAGILRARGRPHDLALNDKQKTYLVTGGGVVIPLIVILVLVFSSTTVGRVVGSSAPDNALTIEVVGHMWWWEVNYLDKNLALIATTANEIHIPVGQPVRFLLKTSDVIHSFWIPNLQGKMDMIPGRVNTSWIEANQAGVYRGQCAEFCGRQHALMALEVVAETADEFSAWLTRESQPAAEPDTEKSQRGLAVFMASSCVDCHTIRGTEATSRDGPDLTHISSRRTLAAASVPNTRGYLGGWILDPQNIKPGSHMPSTPLSPTDLTALLDYLEILK